MHFLRNKAGIDGTLCCLREFIFNSFKVLCDGDKFCISIAVKIVPLVEAVLFSLQLLLSRILEERIKNTFNN